MRVDGAFLGVRVPAGVERMTLDYRPPGFALGVALGAAALIAVIALALGRSQGARVDGRGARAGAAGLDRGLPSVAAAAIVVYLGRQPGARDHRGASSLLAARAVLLPRAQPRALAPRERAGRAAASVPRSKSSHGSRPVAASHSPASSCQGPRRRTARCGRPICCRAITCFRPGRRGTATTTSRTARGSIERGSSWCGRARTARSTSRQLRGTARDARPRC